MICVLFFPAGIWGTLIKRGQAMSDAGNQSDRDHPAHQRRRQDVRQVRRAEQHFGGISQGRDHLDHRPQRRRQEHLFQSAVRGVSADRAARVEFEGRDVTGLPQHRFAHMGVAKSFQITNVFPQLTTRENIRVGLQALVSRYDMWRPRARLHELTEQADELLALVGLWEVARAHRQRRWPMASSARSKSAWRWRAGRGCCCSTSRPPA